LLEEPAAQKLLSLIVKIMKKLKTVLPVVALALLITVGTVYASQAVSEKTKPNCDPEQRAEMQQKMEATRQAIEDNDYQAWAELVEGQPVAEIISQDNFAKFVEMHQLRKQAQTIAEELGLNKMGHMGRGFNGEFGGPPLSQN